MSGVVVGWFGVMVLLTVPVLSHHIQGAESRVNVSYIFVAILGVVVSFLIFVAILFQTPLLLTGPLFFFGRPIVSLALLSRAEDGRTVAVFPASLVE